MNKTICLYIASLIFFSISNAQTKKPWQDDHDTSYYMSYRGQLTTRLYLSRKYTDLKMDPTNGDIGAIKYKPNTTLNIGIGATYHAFTLNIGIGINRFNPDDIKGKTRYLDLQGHFYTRKWKVDFLGEFYKGYYLSPKGFATNDGSYYKRNDMELQLGGIAIYRNLNQRSFSYQAGLLQNEWQKKSAGSFLIGAEAYYGAIHADSVLVPSVVDSNYRKLNITRLHFLEIGPGLGYAYTLVIDQHYFVLGSATMNLALRYNREISGALEHYNKIDVTPNFLFHAGAGYNTEKWCLSILWIGSDLNIRGKASDYHYSVTTGNYRLIYARRFKLNRKTRKILEPINNIMGQ